MYTEIIRTKWPCCMQVVYEYCFPNLVKFNSKALKRGRSSAGGGYAARSTCCWSATRACPRASC